MKGFIASLVSLGSVTGGLMAGGWCSTYHQVVDPCYPERYEYTARQEFHAAFAPQVANGHVLDQTVWNSYFEPGTDRLTPGGMEHLAYLARRRPCPDPVVYLQLTQDVPAGFEADHPERWVEARQRLNAERVVAVQRFLTAYTAGRNLTFQVLVHDPAEVGQGGVPVNVAQQKLNLSADGVLRVYGGIRSTGTP